MEDYYNSKTSFAALKLDATEIYILLIEYQKNPLLHFFENNDQLILSSEKGEFTTNIAYTNVDFSESKKNIRSICDDNFPTNFCFYEDTKSKLIKIGPISGVSHKISTVLAVIINSDFSSNFPADADGEEKIVSVEFTKEDGNGKYIIIFSL